MVKKYSNNMLQKKHCMLKRGSYKGVEMPYIINDVYINEDNDGYFYDISNTNELRKISTGKDIRVTFDTWNLYRPSTGSYVDISELYATCVYRKIIYNCRSLINICASVTTPSKLLTGPVIHIGKLSGIYFNKDEGDLFLITYTKAAYDIVPEDYMEILFNDINDENNCRKDKVRSPKGNKRKLPRSAHKKDIDDDGLKVKKTKREKKSLERIIDHDVTPKLSKYKFIIWFHF